MAEPKWNMAIIGATGAVGEEMISILEERKFPVQDLFLYASKNSSGEKIKFNGKSCVVQKLNEETIKDFSSIDIALLSAGIEVSTKFVPLMTKQGTVCIDNTPTFRMDTDVPLMVPEVNFPHLIAYRKKNIIANPNCTVIQLVQVLKPIHDVFKIKRVVISTYQSVSGKGKKAIEELSQQTLNLLSLKPQDSDALEFPHQIAFNCLPHIGDFFENGYSTEEMKMVLETQKILNDPSIRVSATCVRVPVFYSHAESVNIETHKKASAEDIRQLLSNTKGIVIEDRLSENLYPMNITAAGKDETFVGRIREDLSIQNGIDLWIVSDNLRKGAALNAIQISEALIKEYL